MRIEISTNDDTLRLNLAVKSEPCGIPGSGGVYYKARLSAGQERKVNRFLGDEDYRVYMLGDMYGHIAQCEYGYLSWWGGV